jgi:hypothetical protein
MRFSKFGKSGRFSFPFAVKCVSFTFFFGTLIFCGFYIGSSMISYVISNSNTIHPTSISGIKD